MGVAALGALASVSALGAPMSDPALFLSPCCWRQEADGGASCPAGGGYLKFSVTGTTRITLSVNTAVNRGLADWQMPAVKVVASGPDREGEARYFPLPANGQADAPLAVATGLNPAATYRVTIQATGGDERVESGWAGSTFDTRINRIDLDPGAILIRSTLRPRRALFLGASYEQAFFGDFKEGRPMHEMVDPSKSWPFFVAYAFGCEYGQVGIGSQGWVRHGNGGYPPFPETWDRFDPGHPKAIPRDLDYLFVHMAENDNAQDDGAVERAVAAWIRRARAALGPRTRIFLILSLPQIKSAPIKAGAAAAADPRTYVLDPGREYSRLVFAGGPTWAAPGDGIHLDAVHQALFTAFVTRQAQACIDGVPLAGD